MPRPAAIVKTFCVTVKCGSDATKSEIRSLKRLVSDGVNDALHNANGFATAKVVDTTEAPDTGESE